MRTWARNRGRGAYNSARHWSRRMPVTHHQLPLPLYRAAQVRELDARLIAAGTPAFELMQRAAHGAWRALRQRWPQAGSVTVLAGSGNNAGDGYLVAALAQRAGWQVQVLAVVAPSALRETAAEAYAEALAAGVVVQPWYIDAPLHGVLVDALLGTGLTGAVRAPFAAAIGQINASNLSGLCADTGAELGVAVQAELTVTFIALKLGLLTGVGPDRVGVLHLDDLHADAQVLAAVAPAAQRLAPDNLPRLAARPRTAHKGLYGRVLVVGGDRGLGGAALLTAQAAQRGGAGLVSLATRDEHVPAALARLPEEIGRGVSSANQIGRASW